jgi:hypothetical protein
MKIDEEKIHEEAMDILQRHKLSLAEKMRVRSIFYSLGKEEQPNVEIESLKGEVKYYRSSHKDINHFAFQSENEVVLANAIYLNTKDNFNSNDFIQQLKYTLRMIGANSKWV